MVARYRERSHKSVPLAAARYLRLITQKEPDSCLRSTWSEFRSRAVITPYSKRPVELQDLSCNATLRRDSEFYCNIDTARAVNSAYFARCEHNFPHVI